MQKSRYYEILQNELVPALGCTEPIAIAFAAAKCRNILGTVPIKIQAYLSGNIIKNTKGVIVPNSNGLKGIESSIALGLIAGDPDAELEVLSKVKPTDLPAVHDFLNQQCIDVQVLTSDAKLHIILKMQSQSSSAEVEIMHKHANIVRMAKDGKSIFDGQNKRLERAPDDLKNVEMSLLSILSFAQSADLEILESIIGKQVEYNLAICNEGIENEWGASVGKTVHSFSGNDNFLGLIGALTAAGSDARMGGCNLPVIINSGSGNQGITASMPVVYYCLQHSIDREKMVRALAISNLLAIHQKRQIGLLSAYCGVVSAACGAGAAITWLAGGTNDQIEFTIRNTLGTVSGMVCDGAKPSCAGKIAVAVYAAMIAHEMAMNNRSYGAGDGIVKADIEQTVSGVGEMAREGMIDTDRVILDIMLRP